MRYNANELLGTYEKHLKYMTNLSKDELITLDKKIDSYIPNQHLLKLSRNNALIHLLRYFEDYFRLYSRQDYSSMRNGIDGVNYGIQWIYHFCEDMGDLNLSTNQNNYMKAKEFHDNAVNYSYILDMMSQAFRGIYDITIPSDKKILFKYKTPEIEKLEIADLILSVTEEKTNMDNLRQAREMDLDIEKLIQGLQIQIRGSNKIKYEVTQEIFDYVSPYIDKTTSHLWELDDTWDLGGYSVADFKNVWLTIATLAFINVIACTRSEVEGGAQDSIVPILNKDRWITTITQKSKISKEKINIIFDDLTFDFSLYNIAGMKNPDVIYQPFFNLGSNIFCLSTALVTLSNPERNVWSLLSHKRKALVDELKNKKEDTWRSELSDEFKRYRLESYDKKVNFTFNSKSSDLDLLVIDKKRKLLANCELKWLVAPDHINEVKSANDQLEKGIQQSALALEWIKSVPEKLSTLLQIPRTELSEYKVIPFVISKNTLGVTLDSGQVAIINEVLIKEMVSSSSELDLQSLWKVGHDHAYVPQEGRDYQNNNISAKFGDLVFEGQGLGMIINYESLDIKKLINSS